MSIELINDRELWDKFVDESSMGLLFHKWDFLKIMERYSGLDLSNYGVYDRGKLIGLFPIFVGRYKGIKSVFSPPPKLAIPYLGLVMSREYDTLPQNDKEHHLEILSSDISAEIEGYSPDYLFISGTPGFIDMRYFIWGSYQVRPLYTYVFHLNRGLENLLKGFKKDARKYVRDAEKNGCHLELGEDVSPMHDMLTNRYHEQNLAAPIQDKGYLIDLCKAYPEIHIYYLYDKEGEILNFQLTQEYKKRFLLWEGSMRTSQPTNEYIEWSMIRRAAEGNYSVVEELGANSERLCQFKSKFNPSIEVYLSISKRSMIGSIARSSFEKLSHGYWRRIIERPI